MFTFCRERQPASSLRINHQRQQSQYSHSYSTMAKSLKRQPEPPVPPEYTPEPPPVSKTGLTVQPIRLNYNKKPEPAPQYKAVQPAYTIRHVANISDLFCRKRRCSHQAFENVNVCILWAVKSRCVRWHNGSTGIYKYKELIHDSLFNTLN